MNNFFSNVIQNFVHFCVLGGVSHGPRGPTSYYYMLPMKVRVQGLKIALTSKLAQVRDHTLMINLCSSSIYYYYYSVYSISRASSSKI